MSKAPFVRNSQTSKAAADAIEPKLNRMEGAVLTFIRGNGPPRGATDDELTTYFTRPPHEWAEPTARARRVALMHKGFVVDSGKLRRTRPRGNRLGRWAVVWVVAEREPGQ